MRVEPGTRCLVTGYNRSRPATAANVGREVTVVRWLREGEICSEIDAIVLASGWLITAEKLVIQYDSGEVELGDFAGADTSQLMPLHPPTEEPSQCARQSKLTPA